MKCPRRKTFFRFPVDFHPTEPIRLRSSRQFLSLVEIYQLVEVLIAILVLLL